VARRAGLDERAVDHCQLAVDEACTNVIEHGYHFDGAEQVIDIVCLREGQKFSITVADDSPAFDPLLVHDPNPSAGLEEREPGGWGVYFIKRLMDEVSYRYEANRNILNMVKYLDGTIPTRTRHPNDKNRKVMLTSPKTDVWVVAPYGRLDTEFSQEVEEVLNKQLAAGHRCLVVDLTHVDYIASKALRVIVGTWQYAREHKMTILLAGLQPRVREVFAIIGLDMVLTIFDTPEAAIASLSNSS
jgi:anti-anti-sigma factor